MPCSWLQRVFVRFKVSTTRVLLSGQTHLQRAKEQRVQTEIVLHVPLLPAHIAQRSFSRIMKRSNDTGPDLSRIWKTTIFVVWAAMALGYMRLVSSPKNPSRRPRSIYFLNWMPHPPRRGMSVATLSRNHERWTKLWKKSVEFQELVTYFEEAFDNDSIDITACVGLCLGTLSGPSWMTESDTCDASMSQLVIFESMSKYWVLSHVSALTPAHVGYITLVCMGSKTSPRRI